MSNKQSARTVLVTGSAVRLGRDIALGLAAAGWRVAIHYRGSQAEASQTASECSAIAKMNCASFQADLADEAQALALVPSVLQQFGTLDALVNSASLFEHDDVRTFDYGSLSTHMRVNAGAPVVLSLALHAHLASRGAAGAVVNLLDQKLWNPNPDFLSYTLSKAALESANTLLAQALAPRLRVVGVAPGLTITSHYLTQERFEELHRMAPLGRSSTPQDVVSAVRFALENPAITGTTLIVDGGQHLTKFDHDFSVM